MAKTMKKLDSKLQKQQQGWPKISNTARKHDKDENLEKSEIALAEAARAISAFWKTHSCKLIPNWTRNRMITYTNRVAI